MTPPTSSEQPTSPPGLRARLASLDPMDRRALLAAVAGGLLLVVVAGAAWAAAAGATRDAERLRGEITALDTRLAEAETTVAELRDSQLQVLGELLQFQQELDTIAPDIRAELQRAAGELADFRTSVIEFTVPIDEVVDLDLDLPLNRTIDVAIDTTLPIRETIETTITVGGPFGIDIPLDVTVPIDLDLPVSLTVPITIDETIPIRSTVPVVLEFPVRLPVADTELTRLIDGLDALVEAFDQVLRSLGS